MKYFLTFCCLIILLGCKKDVVPQIEPRKEVGILYYTEIVDTKTKDISFFERKVFSTNQGVFASNMFDGARINGFSSLNDSTFLINCFPENEPINSSPWYSFKIWSKTPKKVFLVFNYGDYQHRYAAKLSKNGSDWIDIDTKNRGTFEKKEKITLNINSDTIWVSAQELYTGKELDTWLSFLQERNSNSSLIKTGIAGKSKLGREIKFFEICEGINKNKDLVVLLSRQHPPEVTGQFALTAFVEGILTPSVVQTSFLKKYNVLVLPILNPDGVALGQWRHNAGGIDLNRDWALYNQPETKVVSDFIKDYAKTTNNRVVLGLDFHSTFNDVYYTNLSDSISVLPKFTNTWLKSIQDNFSGYKPEISPSILGQPVSKNWFFVNFNAVGITYEIGDNTPRKLIDEKGKFAALKMMEILPN
jgi:hypothetical protein